MAKFVPLLGFKDDYEIETKYPFTIRRKRDKYEVSEFDRGDGYPCVKLNGKLYDKRRLIAQQFIPNLEF